MFCFQKSKNLNYKIDTATKNWKVRLLINKKIHQVELLWVTPPRSY